MEQVKRYSGFEFIRSLIRAKGAPYPISWAHRIAGVLLVLYALIHINTLASLSNPEEFSRKARMFSGALPMFLEWLLALPVIFHALNGGRLCIYEIFSTKSDEVLLRWVVSLTAGFMVLLGYFMVLGNQFVTPHFFWICALIAGGAASAAMIVRLRRSASSKGWKLQRISGTLLFVLVPAHMLFMHLNPEVGRDVLMISERMAQPLIKFVDAILLSGVLFHGGYGLLTIAGDYIATRRNRLLFSGAAVLILLIFWLQGFILIITI
jgi:succinate dehydrogenase / fumarate reductase membrane anchor subunit